MPVINSALHLKVVEVVMNGRVSSPTACTMPSNSHYASPSTNHSGRKRPWTTYLLIGVASCILTFVWVSPHSALPLVPAASISHFSDLNARGDTEFPSPPRRSEQGTHITTEAVEATPQALFTTNNLTDQVGWDEYSLFLRGQRIIL